MKEIYRGYEDTEATSFATRIKCPYCGEEWLEESADECGVTYELYCDDEDGGCGKWFKMHFDA